MKALHDRRLGALLVQHGATDGGTCERVLAEGTGRTGDRLLEAGAITESDLADALAEQFHLDTVRLDEYAIPAELFDVLPAHLVYRWRVVPLSDDGEVLRLATADPFDLRLRERIEAQSLRRTEFALATPSGIEAVLDRSKGRAELLRGVSEDFRPVLLREDQSGQEEAIDMDRLDEASAPVIKLVNSILSEALERRASDIHIETFEDGIAVKYRIDGVLYPATEVLDTRHHAALVSRLKVMAELDIAEKRVPQDGRFRMRLQGRAIDCRVSILPATFGEDVVIRILDKSGLEDSVRQLDLTTLGMDADTLRRFRKAIREPYGMVLITGPTGSGKTTTLYAALSEMNSGEEKIITIEEPVEYQLEGIIQIPVNEKKDLTFARGLRSILRHDPDRIMVGEIRDRETAQIAVQSSLTGHLVFSTVHANNVFDVIWRFTHMGIELHNFVSALNCVLAQRLVRRICEQCRAPAEIDHAELELSDLDPEDYREYTWYQGRGCERCGGTGYRGRVAITEMLEVTPRMRDLIGAQRPMSELQEEAAADGFRTLRQSALVKARNGETTLREINRVTFVD